MSLNYKVGANEMRITKRTALLAPAYLVAATVLALWSPAHAQTEQTATQTTAQTTAQATTRTELVDALGKMQTQLTELSTTQPEQQGRLLELTAQLKVLTLQLELEQELAKHAALTERLAQASPKSGRAKLLARLEQLSSQQETLDAQFVIAAQQHEDICLDKDHDHF